MRAAFSPAPVSTPAPILVDRSKKVRAVGWLIVLYILLLMFEGALRKWALPKYSNPLLVVRDPILILIYFMALRARVFPRNRYIISIAIIGVLSLAFSVYFLAPYLPWMQLAAVTLYGFRSNYFHMPLIFVMANVLDEGDVKRIGWWVLLGMIPMALLMVAQFQAPPDSFINGTAGLGEGAEQLGTAGGKIRPAGTFSFSSGPIFYCSMAAAFLIYGILSRAIYRIWLLIPSGIALVVAVGVSGSRGCVVSVLLVLAAMLVVLIIRPQAVNQFGRLLLIVIIAAFVIARLPSFKEGVNVLSERFAAATEEQQTNLIGGMFNRAFEGFIQALTNLDKFGVTGWGLGLGTNVGAHFLVGGPAFLLSENEWPRVLYESGPFLGLAFLLWRTILTLHLLVLSVGALLKRSAVLPILLFSCGFYVLLAGQLGQPTTLGFAVVLSGLCLASLNQRKANTPPKNELTISATTPPKPLPRRSPFAGRIHGEVPAGEYNGLADR